jgi:HAE1 family hydrophobic/amphiphilic exporter-1
VILEVEPRYQRTPDALSALYVHSAQGSLVPIESLVKESRTVGALSINHFGQLPAVTVSFNLKPGFSLGSAADQVNATLRQMRMPSTISDSFQGTVKEFQESFRNLTTLLMIAVLVIYIVLGILYEASFIPSRFCPVCRRRYSALSPRCFCSTRNWIFTPSSE